MSNVQNEPVKNGPPIEEASMSDLRWASEELKARIAEAKAHNDMPFDSTLGNPTADGHLDLPDDDDGRPHLSVDPSNDSAIAP
jgi:hypothetical protein